MDQNWKQIAFAFFMGVCMPVLVMQAQRLTVPNVQPPPSTQGTESRLPQISYGEEIFVPVRLADGTVRVMELESYLTGVVMAEMPSDFEPEALKAQAVVARTYTLRRIADGDRHPGGAVCTDFTCCQAFITEEAYLANGKTAEDISKIQSAVAATAGQVLTYGAELADATYFSCSGGRTEDAAAVWGTEIPYLQAVDSPGEENAAPFEDSVYFTAQEFADRLLLTPAGSPAGWLGWATYTDGYGVDTMVIGGKTYSGVQLRQLLGLRSTMFTMTADEAGITVKTRGNGHRVGMSQYGADAMAVAGSTYEEILAHYYRGTVLEVYSVEHQ